MSDVTEERKEEQLAQAGGAIDVPCPGASANARTSGTRVMTSSFRGVCWHRKSKRWQSAINSSGRHIYLGSFDTQEEAARMFDKVALHTRGARAKLNFPYKDYLGPDSQLLTDSKLKQLVSEARKAFLEKQHQWLEFNEVGRGNPKAKRRCLGAASTVAVAKHSNQFYKVSAAPPDVGEASGANGSCPVACGYDNPALESSGLGLYGELRASDQGDRINQKGLTGPQATWQGLMQPPLVHSEHQHVGTRLPAVARIICKSNGGSDGHGGSADERGVSSDVVLNPVTVQSLFRNGVSVPSAATACAPARPSGAHLSQNYSSSGLAALGPESLYFLRQVLLRELQERTLAQHVALDCTNRSADRLVGPEAGGSCSIASAGESVGVLNRAAQVAPVEVCLAVGRPTTGGSESIGSSGFVTAPLISEDATITATAAAAAVCGSNADSDMASLVGRFLDTICQNLPPTAELEYLIPCADGTFGYTFQLRTPARCSGSRSGIDMVADESNADAGLVQMGQTVHGDGVGGLPRVTGGAERFPGKRSESMRSAGGDGGVGAGIFFRRRYRGLGAYSTSADALQACKACMTMLLELQESVASEAVGVTPVEVDVAMATQGPCVPAEAVAAVAESDHPLSSMQRTEMVTAKEVKDAGTSFLTEVPAGKPAAMLGPQPRHVRLQSPAAPPWPFQHQQNLTDDGVTQLHKLLKHSSNRQPQQEQQPIYGQRHDSSLCRLYQPQQNHDHHHQLHQAGLAAVARSRGVHGDGVIEAEYKHEYSHSEDISQADDGIGADVCWQSRQRKLLPYSAQGAAVLCNDVPLQSGDVVGEKEDEFFQQQQQPLRPSVHRERELLEQHISKARHAPSQGLEVLLHLAATMCSQRQHFAKDHDPGETRYQCVDTGHQLVQQPSCQQNHVELSTSSKPSTSTDRTPSNVLQLCALLSPHLQTAHAGAGASAFQLLLLQEALLAHNTSYIAARIAGSAGSGKHASCHATALSAEAVAAAAATYAWDTNRKHGVSQYGRHISGFRDSADEAVLAAGRVDPMIYEQELVDSEAAFSHLRSSAIMSGLNEIAIGDENGRRRHSLWQR